MNTDSSNESDFDGLSKAELFDHIAKAHDGFAFEDSDIPKVGVLFERLGPLYGRSVLEPGCGTGHLTEYLAYWTEHGGRVLAFDPSPEMLRRARARVAEYRNVTTQLSTLEDLKAEPASFDLALCFRVWPHFEDDDRALASLARHLKPGGRLLIVHWQGRRKLAEIHASHHSICTDVFPPREELEAAFRRQGFETRVWIDNEEEIYIEALLTAVRGT